MRQQHEKELATVRLEGSFEVLMSRSKVGEVGNRRPLCQQRLELGFCDLSEKVKVYFKDL